MACPEWDDLLREGSVGHAAHCEKCRALLDALAYVDATFESAFADIRAPAGMAAAAREQVKRQLPERVPSLLPEVLDFIGWAAVLAIAAIIVLRYVPVFRALLAGLG